MVVCAATAFFYTNRQTRMYSASARLMYEPPTDISDLSSGSSVNTDFMAIQLQSVGTVLQDPTLRALAEDSFDKNVAALDYTVTADVVIPEVSTSNATFPNMAEITAETTEPKAAAAIANAYAAAVIAQRRENQQKRYRAAQKVVLDQLELYVTGQSKLTADYAILKQQLRNLKVAEATSTGDFVVVVPAEPSDDPVAPQPIRSTALGLIGGLAIGVVFVFGLSRMDNRLHGHRDVAQAMEAPILGRIPKSREVAASGDLPTLSAPDSPVSEALRMARSNLEWANVDGDVRMLLFTSCLKGEGKTTTVCNLAVAMARAGKDVVVVDGDLRAPRVHRVFALSNSLGLSSLVRGSVQLPNVLQSFVLTNDTKTGAPSSSAGGPAKGVQPPPSGSSPQGVSIQVLTSGPLPPDPGEVVASRKMGEAMRRIRDLKADYILIDAPPVLSVGDAAALSAHTDGIVVVVNVDKVRKPALADGRELLDALPCRKLGVVVVGEEIEYRHYYE
jgi:non-specific protein-tyrosine kinase